MGEGGVGYIIVRQSYCYLNLLQGWDEGFFCSFLILTKKGADEQQKKRRGDRRALIILLLKVTQCLASRESVLFVIVFGFFTTMSNIVFLGALFVY